MPPRHLAPSGAPVGQSGSSGNSGHISITSIRRRIAELIVYGECHSPSLISSTSCPSLLSFSQPSKQTSKQAETYQNALTCENLFTDHSFLSLAQQKRLTKTEMDRVHYLLERTGLSYEGQMALLQALGNAYGPDAE